MAKIFRNSFHKTKTVMAMAVLFQLAGTTCQAQTSLEDAQIRKFLIAATAAKNLYVDSISDEKMMEDAIKGILKELDPHSAYTPAKDVQALTEPLQGNFEGIGVQFNMVEDTLVVIQPVSGGPSEKVGIIAGDRIVTVNDTAIAGVKMSKENIMKRLRGPKGTKVRLGIKRQDVKGIHEFTVVRDKIPVYTVDAKYMIDETTGYIKIGSFGATTHGEFIEAVDMLKAKGMKDLVLDLQGNGGGYLQTAVAITNELLGPDELIVYTEGRIQPRMNYKSQGNGAFSEGKLVVLIDSYSASASEILAGAVQDNDRGLIVGRRSFGKGLVQRQIDLPDKSMIRLTIAHYYSPSGRCIQKPYKKGDQKSYDMDIADRLKSGELTNADSIHMPDSLKFTTLKKKRTVYGGGGIMPDVYVELDTTQVTKLYREMSAKSCIINTSLKYIDKHRKKLHKDYSDFNAFNSGFEVPQELIDLLLENTKKAKIEYTDRDLTETMPIVKVQLKALIARDIWDMSEYYQTANTLNNIYEKGVATIKEKEL